MSTDYKIDKLIMSYNILVIYIDNKIYYMYNNKVDNDI